MRIAKLFERKSISGLGRILMILIIAISTLSFSQTQSPTAPPLTENLNNTGFQINVVSEGYYRVYIGDSLISQHRFEREAIQSVLNQKLKNTLANVRVEFPEKMRVDFEGKLLIHAQEIDTIILSRMSREIGGWLDFTNAGLAPSPLRAYLPFTGIGMVEIQTAKVYNWQKEYRFERTKSFGKTIYKELDIPFQFVADTITRQPTETSYRWQTFATEKHCIKTYVDNVYTGDADTSCNPGVVNYHGIELRRHSNSLEGLAPKTTYLIRVEGTTESGAFNYIEFEITTL